MWSFFNHAQWKLLMKKLHLTVCLCRHTHPCVVLFISLQHARIVKSESESSQDIQNIVAVQLKKEKEKEKERKKERERERERERESEREREGERERERKGLRDRDCLVR